MSLSACMKSNPFNTLTKAKTRSKSNWAEHALRQVDVHDHQHTLEDHHGHYASVFSSETVPKKTMRMLADKLDEGAEPMHWLQRRQEFASSRCHHEVHAHHHGQPSLASAHHLHHHKHVKELVSSQWTECQ